MTPAVPQRFLAEWYVQDCGEAGLDQVLRQLRAVFGSDAEPAGVSLALVLAVPADEVVFGVFEALSAEAVAAQCRRAGLPPLRINLALHKTVGGAGASNLPGWGLP